MSSSVRQRLRPLILRDWLRAALVLIAVMLGLVALAGQGHAQGVSGVTGAGEGPLEIEADEGIEWRRNEQIYIATGNAVARRGAISVYADQLIAHYRDRQEVGEGEGEASEEAAGLGGTEIYRVEAIGSVRIESENETAYGEHGLYDMDRAVVVLTGGNLRFETPEETITARDSLEFWQEDELAVARGDAEARQGERSIRANVLSAFLVTGNGDGQGGESVKRIEAFENVRIATADEVATGDKGVYEAATQIATLFGDVKMTRGGNQLNGGYAEVNLETGVSRLLGGPPDGEAQQRVRGLLRPEEASGDQAPGE